VHHDHDFGLLLSVGSGGVLVEVLNDIVTTPLPVSHRQAKALVSELRCLPLLKGVRGQSGGDMDALVHLLVTVSQFSLANEAVLATLDLNPVIVHAPGKGITVADALITTRSADAPADSN
jgi:acyl-CoA synthetase (NDP forming)